MWVYGSGFPKSLDVSKAIDKAAGATREVVGIYKQPDNANRRAGSGPRIKDQVGEFGYSGSLDVTASATEAAKEWEGWGTALKPAWEPIIVARKPFKGTVATNILEHGTGGLNIEDSRIGFANPADESESKIKNRHADFNSGPRDNKVFGEDNRNRAADGNYDPPGRFPANLIHDGSEEVLERFPQSSVTGKRSERSKDAKVGNTNWLHDNHQSTEYIDKGSAARFFYCAKASKAERGKDNNHPTVKPIALMRYLCRLITPPGGTILDPFMGSGSTGLAAFLEEFAFIGIEKELPSFKIARNRVGQIQQQCDYFGE